MRELGRIFSRRRLVLGLALIFLLNGLLFIREQRDRDYGLDLELPVTGGLIFFDGTFTVTQEPPDAWAAYQTYTQWLDWAKSMPLADAVTVLEDEKEALSPEDRLDYVAVNNLFHQTDYLTGYGDWLENIRRNKENLLTFSIFNDPESFSGRNILKTAEEFERLEGVELTLGADGAIEAFMTFRLTDYFLLLALLLICLSFLEERKAGLWSVVHAAPRGRLRLALRRTLILLGASAVGVVLLYGTDLVLGFSIYGGAGDLDRAVQSVETLGRLPMLATVAGFLVRVFLLRVAAAFLVSLLLWLMLTAVNNVKYTILAAAGVLAVEYSLYTFLPVQSAFNIFKYFNLFTYISLSDLYTNYLNIDIFTYPLGIRSVSQLALAPLCLLLTAVCVTVHCHKKPAAGRDLLGRVAYRLNSVTDKLLCRLGLFGMELHKTLWIQKGIVIAALLVYAALGLSYTVNIPIMSSAEQAARQYTTEFAGEITENTFTRMDAEQAELDAIIAARDQAQADFDNGLIEYPMLDKYAREAATAQTKSEGLSKVRARCEELWDRGVAEGFAPWLVDETPFESVYGVRAEANRRRAALTAVLALTLLLAGGMAYERQSGMTYLLKSTARGRGALLLRKLLLAAAMTTLVWAAVYGMEVYTFLTAFDIPARAPAKNLSMLTDFPLNASVALWLALLYALRWVCLYGIAVMVLSISGLFRRLEAATIAGSAVTLLPSVLCAYVGIAALRPLSAALSLSAAPLPTLSGTAALLAAAAACAGVLYFSWKGRIILSVPQTAARRRDRAA